MFAAKEFVAMLAAAVLVDRTRRIVIELNGSLASTGSGHYTDRAAILGLEGNEPGTIDVEAIATTLDRVARSRRITLEGGRRLEFDLLRDVLFRPADFSLNM